ncbi:hypothetical protein EZV62_024978 [Acer yangbiense]|uniref:Uncharacterized protein n=1 Tax=Acer yangbiense TaxID=1000413 RepID=A0A5C7GWI8_9ROSI|nr:hypothetical protein EZV62_024978 [Acer yangbiense]
MTPSTVMAKSISDDDDDSFTKPLGRRSVTYYGSGHMLNDITAACWFTYLLLFLTDIGLSPRAAASVMLSGQIADAFATIFTGELKIDAIKAWGTKGALMMVTGISMQNVLIGEDLNGCAFVCGSLSFLDKMSCEIALYILQSYQSTSLTRLDNFLVNPHRYGLGLVPAICSLLGVAVTYTMELCTPYSKSLTVPPLE